MTLDKKDFVSNIYIHPPRTGGTVIRRKVRNINHIDSGHRSFADVVKTEGRNHFYYGTVRNPLSRLLSIYYSSGYMMRVLKNLYKKEISFSEFVKKIPEIKLKNVERQALLTQYDMLVDGNDKVDFFIRTENLKNDFLKFLNIAKKSEVDVFSDKVVEEIVDRQIYVDKKATFNRNNGITNGSAYPNSKHYLEYYDEKTLQLAVDIYKKDFDYFGYEVE